MTLIPAFELGLWNAWIFMLCLLLQNFLVFFSKGLKGRMSHPSGAALSRAERTAGNTSQLLWYTATLYSVFLPLKLGTAWFYIGLALFTLGLAAVAVAAAAFVATPLDRPVSGGLYRLSRHPIYIGLFLIYLGTGLASASWAFLLLAFVAMVLMHSVVLYEERFCLQRYGDAYRRYRDRTPRWLGMPGVGRDDG